MMIGRMMKMIQMISHIKLKTSNTKMKYPPKTRVSPTTKNTYFTEHTRGILTVYSQITSMKDSVNLEIMEPEFISRIAFKRLPGILAVNAIACVIAKEQDKSLFKKI